VKAPRVEELVRRYGLWAVFFGTAVEGDLGLILGGVAAHLGLMHPLAVGIAGALGGFAGDSAWFAVGRRSARELRESAVYRRVGPTIERLVARFGPAQILLARPVWGTRVASMLFWGTQRLAPARFAALDLPASSIWAVLLVSLGYFSSLSVEALLGKVRHVEEWLAGAVVVALAIAIARRLVVARRVRSSSS
jgi:membrane protein DedA with SNARE-associated domain